MPAPMEEEIADVAVDATVLDDEGGARGVNACRLNFSYQTSAVPEGWVSPCCPSTR